MTAETIRKYQKQLSDLRDRLSSERRQLLEQVQKPVGNVDANDISSASLAADMVGGEEGEEEVAIKVYDSVDRTYTETVAALDRIERGVFGICEGCGKKISQARLKALPHARRCTACSRQAESKAAKR